MYGYYRNYWIHSPLLVVHCSDATVVIHVVSMYVTICIYVAFLGTRIEVVVVPYRVTCYVVTSYIYRARLSS